MLDNLVESNTTKQQNGRGKFFSVSSMFFSALMITAFVWSLFGAALDIGNSDLEISRVVAPIDVSPAIDEPEPQPQTRPTRSAPQSEMPTRQTNTMNLNESPREIPTISVVKPAFRARPNGDFRVGSGPEKDGVSSARDTCKDCDVDEGFSQRGTPTETTAKLTPKEAPKPPVIAKKPEVEKTPQKALPPQTGGVLNGKALSLPKPLYPAAAKAIQAKGMVTVQVLIDESGNVISASAASGHPLLRGEAVKAAYRAKFSPTKLSNVPVKVSGVINYNFQ